MKLPVEFESRMKHQLQDDFIHFINALDDSSPISIRLNPYKTFHHGPLERVQWCDNGYYLPERPVFASDPLWHNGSYYVQEASSMMIETAFKAIKSSLQHPLIVLDACAAPGGKSTHLANLLGDDDVLVSNEVIKSRVPVLFENITKNGYQNTIITNADTEDFRKIGAIFDVILIDAPCSGEGLFRKDADATNEWNLENVKTCELRQKRILENLKHCVKPGGYIIYSTCTYNPGENQDQVQFLMDNGFEKASFNIGGESFTEYQCYPHKTKGEGFYIALLKQTKDLANTSSKSSIKLKPLKPENDWNNFLKGAFNYYKYNDAILAIAPHVFEFYSTYLNGIYTYSIGVEIGQQKDKLFTPSPYIAFSRKLDINAFQLHELEHLEALNYLYKNAISIQERDKKGYVLVSFKGSIIGLGKYAGNRINNLFPNEWKLRRMPVQNEVFTLLN